MVAENADSILYTYNKPYELQKLIWAKQEEVEVGSWEEQNCGYQVG